MIAAKPTTLACAAALATGLFAASSGWAQPSGVAPLSVIGGHPTTVYVGIKGKDEGTVRKEVAIAARYVCRNFIGLKGISLGDVDGCADRASTKAMKQYAMIVKWGSFADDGAVVLSAR